MQQRAKKIMNNIAESLLSDILILIEIKKKQQTFLIISVATTNFWCFLLLKPFKDPNGFRNIIKVSQTEMQTFKRRVFSTVVIPGYTHTHTCVALCSSVSLVLCSCVCETDCSWKHPSPGCVSEF